MKKSKSLTFSVCVHIKKKRLVFRGIMMLPHALFVIQHSKCRNYESAFIIQKTYRVSMKGCFCNAPCLGCNSSQLVQPLLINFPLPCFVMRISLRRHIGIVWTLKKRCVSTTRNYVLYITCASLNL